MANFKVDVLLKNQRQSDKARHGNNIKVIGLQDSAEKERPLVVRKQGNPCTRELRGLHLCKYQENPHPQTWKKVVSEGQDGSEKTHVLPV